MKGFYNRGKNSAIIHCSCPLWSCRSFGVAELSSAFILFKKLPHCWFGHSKFLLSLWLVYFGRFSTPSPKNLKTAFSIFRINSAFLFLFSFASFVIVKMREWAMKLLATTGKANTPVSKSQFYTV